MAISETSLKDVALMTIEQINANLDVMASDAKKMRGDRPFIFTNLRSGDGVGQVVDFIQKQGLLDEIKSR